MVEAGGEEARAAIYSGEWEMVILDEFSNKMLDPAAMAGAPQGKPEMVHVVLTGGNGHPMLVELADAVTEMREVKHAYSKGILAQNRVLRA